MSLDMNFLPFDRTNELRRQTKSANLETGVCPEIACSFVNAQISDGVLRPFTKYIEMVCHDAYGVCPRYQELNSLKQK